MPPCSTSGELGRVGLVIEDSGNSDPDTAEEVNTLQCALSCIVRATVKGRETQCSFEAPVVADVSA